ncbi:MAG: hypothetical protein JWM33_3523 [Caulobacteraceae bacterium]|nr:hypothetical protein [Caulobacteraceae bacterium]
MPANTATSVFSDTPVVGIDVGAKSSTPAFKPKTNFLGSDGYRYFYVRASEVLGSIDTVKIGAAGSASSDIGSAGFTLNAPGGLTAGQYGWARKTAL